MIHNLFRPNEAETDDLRRQLMGDEASAAYERARAQRRLICLLVAAVAAMVVSPWLAGVVLFVALFQAIVR